jgi:hypothetical protein
MTPVSRMTKGRTRGSAPKRWRIVIVSTCSNAEFSPVALK